ncbi:hypothetical protein OAG52_03155, partial [Verrucomicrobia bacterium]|nr:hypothetical protein [Verrucomicrobiota bacterium]
LSEDCRVTDNQQERYDDAMYLFSQEDYKSAIEGLESILIEDENAFDARLSLGMAFCRLGDFERAIQEGHKAAELKPNEQLVHTNLSLFYMRSGDKETAEHHGLQARIASWKQDMAKPTDKESAESSELSLAKAPPKPYKTPEKFPDMPWKKNQ